MKKIIRIAAVAVFCSALCGCADFLDFMSKSASFQFSSQTAYDGQSMVLKRMSSCCYEWAVTSGSQYVINPSGAVKVHTKYTEPKSTDINGQDSTAVITFSLGSSKNNSEKVTVKAWNRLYPDEESYCNENTVEVHKWSIRIKDCQSGKDASGALKANVPYMAYLVDLATGEPIEKIVFNLTVTDKYRSEEIVTFDLSDMPSNEKIESSEELSYNPNVAIAFKLKQAATSSDSISATLNGQKITLAID